MLPVVQFARRSRLARTMALVILMWTAIDLVHPSACALDASPSDAPSIQADPGIGLPIGSAPVGHVDDCFCCSHCVHPSAMAVPVVWRPVVVQRAYRHRDRLPSADRTPVYHPPQLVS